MDEPTIPIRPLADTPPKAKPPQPKSQPASTLKPQPAAPKIDPSIEPRIEPWLAPAAPKTEPGAFKPETAADAGRRPPLHPIGEALERQAKAERALGERL